MIDDAQSAAERQARFIARFMNAVPHLAALGITYKTHGDDWAEMALPYAVGLVGFPDTGVLASGPIFSLMDSVCGMAVQIRLGRWEPHATLDLRCDYLRPATPGVEVIGRGECYKLTRRVAFVRGLAHDGDPARPVAHVTGTFMRTGVPA